MEWLTERKIPVGDTAEIIFDWIETNLQWLLDWLSDSLEIMIEAILWIMQEPNPLIVIAAFVVPVSYTHLTLPTNREV